MTCMILCIDMLRLPDNQISGKEYVIALLTERVSIMANIAASWVCTTGGAVYRLPVACCKTSEMLSFQALRLRESV